MTAGIEDEDDGALLDIRRVSARRSLVLAAAGALLGLVLAAYALFTARGTSSLMIPLEDVAMVNDQPIARSDFAAALEALYAVTPGQATAEQRSQILNDLIREELFVQRGKELDVAAFDPDVRTAMVRSVEESAAADGLTRVPTEAQLLSFYQAHPDRYASEGVMTVRDLLFSEGEAAATAAVEALRAGRGIEEVVVRFGGRDTAAVKGDEFYFAAKIHLGERLFAAARELETGAVGGPFAERDGAHVLFMVKNRVPLPFSFDQARARVQSDYTRETIARLQTKQTDFLRKRANVRVAEHLE